MFIKVKYKVLDLRDLEQDNMTWVVPHEDGKRQVEYMRI